MKDKIVDLKDKFVQMLSANKKVSAIVAALVLAIVVIIIVTVSSIGNGSRQSKNAGSDSNESQIKNNSGNTGNTSLGDTKTNTGGEGSTDQTVNNAQENEGETSTGTENNGQNTNSSNGTSGSENAKNTANTGNTVAGGTANTGNGENTNNSGTTNNLSGYNAGNTGTTGNNGSNTTGGSTGSNTGNSTGSSTGNGGNNASTGNTTNPATPSGTDTPQPNQETIYNQLFDINNKVTITLDISDAELQKLQADYKKYGSNGKSPIYRRVTKMTVTINGNSYEMYDVGVRIKGNTSRCDVYNNNNVNDRNLIHLKLSFDETFDDTEYYGSEALTWSDAARKQRKERTFATLDGLELKWNRNFDGTYVANYYANQMYRAFGVYAQNTSLANIRFGGYNYGVYTIYEPVNKNFVKRYMPGATDGDLYKCGWGSGGGASYTTGTLSSIGVETPYQSLTYDLKTNKSSSTHASLKNLINKLNNGNVSKTDFSNLVDANNWVYFVAVSYFAGNPDDLRNNYNNHCVYFKNGKAVFIPYDYDRCFGIATEGREDMTTFSPYADNTALQGGQSNPLYLKSVTGRSNNFTAEYTAALKQVANSGWLNYSNYQQYYNKAKNNYSSVVIPDSNVHIYVKAFGSSSGSNQNSSKLAFNENNGYNVYSVSTYMTKIMQRYNEAMSK